MRPLDRNTYLGEVLGPSKDGGQLPSLFDRYLLDPDDEDQSAIDARLAEVKSLWNKKGDHPTYGSIIGELLKKHDEAVLTLGDDGERRKEAERVASERRAQTEKAAREAADWDETVEEFVKSRGGLDPGTRARLEEMASRVGIDAGKAKVRLDAAPMAEKPKMVDDGEMRKITRAITDLARDLAEPKRSLSLYHALDLEGITLDVTVAADRIDALVEQNNKRGQSGAAGTTKILWSTVLQLAKIHLVKNDARGYIEGLVDNVRAQLDDAGLRAAASDSVIDETEAEHLQSQAIELGLSAELARRVVAEIGKRNDVVVRTGAPVDYTVCPACNHPHPRSKSGEGCVRCGVPLFISCPADGCGTKNDATAAKCTQCGADLHRYAEATRKAGTLANLIGEGRVAQAHRDLEEVRAVLGDSSKDVQSATGLVTTAFDDATRSWAKVDSQVSERKVYSAQKGLRDLAKKARDLAGPDGSLPRDALDSVEKQIAAAERELEKARGASGDAREAALVKALSVAADCREAERELDQIPPAPPSSVKVAITEAGATISWSTSSTVGASYEVFRVNRRGGSRELVGKTDETRIEDREAEPGSSVSYTVESRRGSSRSSAAESTPVVIAIGVEDLRVMNGDGEVRISWASVRSGRVLLQRREESSGRTTTLVPDTAGFTDRDVVNGQRYIYLVRVEYESPSGPVQSPAITAHGQPAARPVPLEGLVARSTASGVSIKFSAPDIGTVAVYKGAAPPDHEPGDELDPESLSELGETLEIGGSGAVDSRAARGVCWYLPVTIAGGVAIAGQPLRHVGLPVIDKVKAVLNGNKLKLTWTWPQGVSLARIVWRTDRRPNGPDDPAAQSRAFRVGEYKDKGGFTIGVEDGEPVFAVVVPAMRLDGELVWPASAPKGAWVAAGGGTKKTEVRYSVRRSGIRQKRLEIQVSGPDDHELPGLVLVARKGEILPRSSEDGEIVARFGEKEPRTHTLERSALPRPAAIRLFLDSSGAEATHLVFDPVADQLVIK